MIPFLTELRVITDWTVTETSMNLFMWMKLEDAHHGLYRTRLDMEGPSTSGWAGWGGAWAWACWKLFQMFLRRGISRLLTACAPVC